MTTLKYDIDSNLTDIIPISPEFKDGHIVLNITVEQFADISKGLTLLYKRREYGRNQYAKNKESISQKSRKAVFPVVLQTQQK